MKNPNDLRNINSDKNWEWCLTFVGAFMCHNYRLYPILDEVFNTNTQINSIIEIGMDRGALTTYLGLWGLKRNIPVATIDIKPNTNELLSKLNVVIRQGDVFSKEIIDFILDFTKGQSTLLFCDGGFKEKEFTLFAPLIPKQSIICAHDLGYEFFIQNVSHVIIDNKLSPIVSDRWMEMHVATAIFKKE